MKNATMMFVVLFVTAFAGVTMAESSKFPLDKNEEAFLAAPCPMGQEDVWCVAIKSKTSSEPEWEYRLSSHRADGTDPFGFVKVLKARIETITVKHPKHAFISSDEIMKAYNGEPIEHITVRLNWFQSYTTTQMLIATRTDSKIVFSVNGEKTRSGLCSVYTALLFVFLLIAFGITLLAEESRVILLMIMIAAMLVFSVLVTFSLSNSWIQACVPFAACILGIILGEIAGHWYRTTHKSANNPS